MERPRRVDVAEAAGVDRVVGRLHHHDELGGERVALEQRRERAVGDGQLLAAEEQRAERRAVADELDHHRERALHVAGAEPDHAVAVAAPRPVALGGDGVEVAAEQHPCALRAGEHAGVAEVARVRQQVEHVLREPLLVPGLRGDVDQLERTRGDTLAQIAVALGHERARYAHALLRHRCLGQAGQPAALHAARAQGDRGRRARGDVLRARDGRGGGPHDPGLRPRRGGGGDRRAVRPPARAARRRRARARRARPPGRALRAHARVRRGRSTAAGCRSTRCRPPARRRRSG